jgi:hypothetical protein
MDRRSTKSRGEREDEEVERLVRPSPKVKPPRHDRRRERVEVDHDPDVKTPDKDLSMNFKDIGGSMASNIAQRWAANLPPAAGEAPKPESQKVKVRSKATGWVGWVSKDRLKEDPSTYEVADGGSEETFGEKPNVKAPAAQKKPKQPSDPKQDTSDSAPHDAERDSAAQSELLAIAKDDPSFAAFLKSFKNPKSEVYQFAENNPTFKAKPFMQGKELPQGVETVGDLVRVITMTPTKKPKKSAPASPESAKQRTEVKTRLKEVKEELAEDPKSDGAKKERSALQDALSAMDDYDRLSQELEEAKAQLKALDAKGPPTEEEVRERAQQILNRKKTKKKNAPPPGDSPAGAPEAAPEAEPIAQPGAAEQSAPGPSEQSAPAGQPAPQAQPAPAPKGKGKPKDNKGKAPPPLGKGKAQPSEDFTPKYAPGQPERSVSSSERQESDRLVMRSFPQQVASKILFAKPPYHPDEIKTLISDYNLAKSLPPTMLPELLERAPSFYATDANAVKPPKNLGDVPEEQRAQLIRKHQIQTVAMSLATRALVSDNMVKNGASQELAESLSDFLLSGGDEAPADRSKRATQQAEEMFLTGLQQKSKPMSDSDVKKLLHQVANYDPALEKLVVGYCQSRDYQEARELFLDPKSKDAISERLAPRAIAARISKAADFLHKKSERYPQQSISQDTYMIFRNRVMKHLAALSPEKQGEVQGLLDEKDNAYYDGQLRKYEKAAKDYKKQVEAASKSFESDFSAYSKKMRETGDFDVDPPLTVEDRLVQARIEAPKPPVKPPNYDKMTKTPGDLSQESQGLWKQFQQRNAADRTLAARVATRVGANPFSFYSDTFAMDRKAVYWGVAPYPKGHEGFEPYKQWEQPQARDLGESDYSRLLKAAREWLSTPVLSTDIEGIVRDTQLRAALDLALRAENYGHAIHPGVYNKLLARLAGVSEDETLLTVRSKTARNTMSNKKIELETAQADRFLARLDRIASVVQANQKKWANGMDFTDAKNLVNAIDKLADDIETATYGTDSLLNRQASEIGHSKLAQVLERDSDEGYMDTFKNPQKPIQTAADEPYMKAYGDDQSSAVHNGKSSTGKPLAK